MTTSASHDDKRPNASEAALLPLRAPTEIPELDDLPHQLSVLRGYQPILVRFDYTKRAFAEGTAHLIVAIERLNEQYKSALRDFPE